MEGICAICNRYVANLTSHHMIPKDEGGTSSDTVLICRSCHSQIHILFTNKELAQHYYTVPLLKEEERMKKFIVWVQRQPSEKKIRMQKRKH